MNTKFIIAKIKRNLDMLSIAATTDLNTVTVDGAVISCVDASIAAPMGGIDGSVSPFLGMGVANPGQIKVKGAAGENTIAAIMTSELRLKVLSLVMGFGNDVVVEAGDTATELARIPGAVDVMGVGQ